MIITYIANLHQLTTDMWLKPCHQPYIYILIIHPQVITMFSDPKKSRELAALLDIPAEMIVVFLAMPIFRGVRGKLMGKYMGNIWKIYGKYIGNIWKIYGKIWEILCFYGWVSIWFLSSNYGRDSPAMFD